MNHIEYGIELNLSPDEFIDVLVRSTLGVRRPVNEPERIVKMIGNSDLLITARLNGLLIGVARSLTDFAFCTYLSDMAVDQIYQRQGIGKELIRRTKLAAPMAKLILISAPNAEKYYPRIGMSKIEHCYVLNNIADLKNNI